MNNKIIISVLLAAGTLLLLGIFSRPFLGDEIYHFRFAKDVFYSCSRPAFDSQYKTTEMPTILYTSPILWNLSLALLWKVTGGISYFVAQLYQVFNYLVIILMTYLVTKEIYSKKQAVIACLLVASVPMIVSFSILLYTDVPVVALCLTGLLCTIKKKYLAGGIVFGLALLTKNNAAFFLPSTACMILFAKDERFIKKTLNIIFFLLPVLFFYFIDLIWKQTVFTGITSSVIQGINISAVDDKITNNEILDNKMLGFIKNFFVNLWFTRIAPNFSPGKTLYTEYLSSQLLNIKFLIMYFGMALPGLAILYFVKYKEKKDVFLAAQITGYISCVFLLFGLNTDIRYFLPVAPLLCIIISKCLVNCKYTCLKRALIFICILQFVFSAFYVFSRRNINPETQQAFNYINENTPEDSMILYPESNIQEYAKRKLIWSNFKPTTNLGHIFWPENIDIIQNAIISNEIDYIVIKKSRKYRDTEIRHFGGYPDSFVKKLPTYNFVKLKYDNPKISVWEIQKDYLK